MGRFVFFFNDTATTEIYTLSLHDALPIYKGATIHRPIAHGVSSRDHDRGHEPGLNLLRDREGGQRSEEHTSELQSRLHLVCRLLLEKKKARETNARTCAVANSPESPAPAP